MLTQYSDILVVGEAATGEEAVALAEHLQPDVILMDINLPKLDGIEATRLLKRTHPGVVVIGLSVHTTGPVEAAMKAAGATAFINKEEAVEQLYHTILTAREVPGSGLIPNWPISGCKRYWAAHQFDLVSSFLIKFNNIPDCPQVNPLPLQPSRSKLDEFYEPAQSCSAYNAEATECA